MKFHRFKFLAAILTIVALIAGLGVLAQSTAPTLGESAGSTTTITNLAGLPAVGLAAGVATNLNNIVRIPQGKVIQVTHTVAAAGASTDKVFLYYALSSDGTNYATTTAGHINFFSWTLNGTTGVVGNTNIPSTFTEGAKFIKFTVYTNQSAATVYPSNITVGWRN